MNLLCLPKEIIIVIAKKLDTGSCLCLWETCVVLRDVVRSYVVMRRMKICGPASVLKSPSFVDLAQFARELNLSGFRYLDRKLRYADIKNILPYFTNLDTLNVIDTKVSMWDAAKACNMCHRIVNLYVDFKWPDYGDLDRVSRELVEYCQLSFCRLQHVHFRSLSDEILKCGHVFHVLQKCSNLESLHIDLCLNKDFMTSYYHFDCSQPIPPSLHFVSILITEEIDLSPYNQGLLFDLFCNKNWEYTKVRHTLNGIKIEMTDKIFAKAKNIPELSQWVVPAHQYTRELKEVRRFDAWHSDFLRANPDICDKVVNKILSQIPNKVCQMKRESKFFGGSYCISPCVLPRQDSEKKNFIEDKSSNLLFNVDAVVKPLNNVRLILKPWCDCYQSHAIEKYTILSLDTNSMMLRYLTFLSIENCSPDPSFKNIFETCKSMTTLRLVQSKALESDDSILEIIKFVHKSNSIQSLIVVDFNIFLEDLIQYIKNTNLTNLLLGGKIEVNSFCPRKYADLLDDCPNLSRLKLNFLGQNQPYNTRRFGCLKRLLKLYVNESLRKKNFYVSIENQRNLDTWFEIEDDFEFHDFSNMI